MLTTYSIKFGTYKLAKCIAYLFTQIPIYIYIYTSYAYGEALAFF